MFGITQLVYPVEKKTPKKSPSNFSFMGIQLIQPSSKGEMLWFMSH